MSELLTPDLCVIGAGAGGLSVAAAAAQLGADVVLIEKGRMGGDCLNTGCVPSKALLAAAARAQVMRNSEAFGIAAIEPVIDFAGVRQHIRHVIDAIAPNDGVDRFTGLGVQVIQGTAKFLDKNTVLARGIEIKPRYFVIATGSSPAIPSIPGITSVPYFTNETIFDNDRKLDHLLIIGGGPIGLEIAQAYRRLGSKVTVLEAFTPLGKDDPELVKIVLKQLREEGVEIIEGAKIERIKPSPSGVAAIIGSEDETSSRQIEASHLLVATGRSPNLDNLDLDAAGIKFDRHGIKVNRALRTSNRRAYAIGDVTGGLQFTHAANYHAGIVIRRTLFKLPAKARSEIIPWVTYTDPELAHVGLNESQARQRYRKITIERWPYHENDRAQAERATAGFIKVITKPNGKILGASIVGKNAGEIIQMWALAISSGLKIKAMTGFIAPYPTLSEISKRAAYSFYIPQLNRPRVRRIINWLRKFG